MELIGLIIGGATVSLICAIIIANKRKNPTLISIHKKIAKDINDDFMWMGWISWDQSVHWVDGQFDRIQKAAASCSMQVVSFNRNTRVAMVKGETGSTYEASDAGCTCPDFRIRRLPCKHMYFAAMENNNRRM